MGASTFTQHLLTVLRAHPAGLSEFELITRLQASGESAFKKDCLRNTLSLFQSHFFLFHSLYRLRDQLWESGEARLDIHTLRIQLLPATLKHNAQLAEHDPLRGYYLNLDNLENTDETDVKHLLNSFWKKFMRDDERLQALRVLELEAPANWAEIKTQHRRLAMQHHPDRGGDERRLQEINVAMDVLALGERLHTKHSDSAHKTQSE
ncbi:MAG: DnaJ domain-containing protein [Gammaproteobacteria bacterium]|nr:DnaJ domain-containing protein [Gammaproteobacteria bacterium]